VCGAPTAAIEKPNGDLIFPNLLARPSCCAPQTRAPNRGSVSRSHVKTPAILISERSKLLARHNARPRRLPLHPRIQFGEHERVSTKATLRKDGDSGQFLRKARQDNRIDSFGGNGEGSEERSVPNLAHSKHHCATFRVRYDGLTSRVSCQPGDSRCHNFRHGHWRPGIVNDC
jgi:hypothetical protein